MELAHLRTFLAVVEHRGFRRAARRLYLSEPAVSRHVAALERSAGVRLLVRSPEGTEPTAAGRALADQTQGLLDDHARLADCVRRRPQATELVVGISPCGIGELTRPLLAHLGRALPGLRLRTFRVGLVDWPDAMPAHADVLLLRDPFDDERFRSTVLLTEPARVAVPRRLPESMAHRLTLEGVLALPHVTMSPAVPQVFRHYWSLHDARGGVEVEFRGPPSVRADDAPRGVARGYGIAVGTNLLARLYRASCPIPFDGAPTVRTALVSDRDDRRPLIDAVHREAAWVTRRLGPLVLPELAEPIAV